MKKIAFVVPRMGVGGVEHSLLGLLQYAPADLDITLILFAADGELLSQVPSNIHIKNIKSVGRSEAMRVMLSTGLKKMRLHRIFAFLKSIYHVLGPKLIGKTQDGEFDVAIAYSDGLATWYTAKSLNASKKIAFVHTDLLTAGYNADSERNVYKEFNQIFFGSRKAQTHFLQMLPEYAAKTALLPNCVDVKKIKEMARLSCKLPEAADNDIKIITVGRLSHEKGVQKIPEILRLAREDGLNIHWYLVGEGPEADGLRVAAQKLGVEKSLTLLGLQLNPYQYIAQCDVYVQPSNYEGYCIALAEALTLNLPCVACDFSGADEQIQDGVNGFVCGMYAESIYSKLKPLITNKSLRQKMRENIVEHACVIQEDIFQLWWQQI